MARTSRASEIMGVVVVAVIGGILMGLILPIGIDQLIQVDTSGWPDGVALIFNSLVYFVILLPLGAIAAMVANMFRSN